MGRPYADIRTRSCTHAWVYTEEPVHRNTHAHAWVYTEEPIHRNTHQETHMHGYKRGSLYPEARGHTMDTHDGTHIQTSSHIKVHTHRNTRTQTHRHRFTERTEKQERKKKRKSTHNQRPLLLCTPLISLALKKKKNPHNLSKCQIF